MGWLFGWNSKEEIVKHLLYNFRNCGVIDHSVSGKEMWILYTGNDNNKRLMVCVIEKQDGRFGYKDNDVSAGPYYYNCPKRMVLQATYDCENSKEWLQEWEKIHSKEAKQEKEVWKKLKQGDKFLRMVGESSEECIFVREYSKQSIVYTIKEGKVFRCKKNVVKLMSVEIEENISLPA